MKEVPCRSTVKQRLGSWVKAHPSGHTDLDVDWGIDEFPEDQTKDKARSILTRKFKKAKVKHWIIEYKWTDRKAFREFKHWYWFKLMYSKHWQQFQGKRYQSLLGAQDSFKAGIIARKYFDAYNGKEWRIRNLQTGEIHYWNSIDNTQKQTA